MAKIERKTRNGLAAGGSPAAVAGIITSFLPVPVALKALVPGLLATAVHFYTSYRTAHTHSAEGAAAIASVGRVMTQLTGYQVHDRYAMVNAQQIMDLLDPDRMWKSSVAAVAPD